VIQARRPLRLRGLYPQVAAQVSAVADSLEEAGDRLFTFTRLPPSQWLILSAHARLRLWRGRRQ
jgi:hypothetical protein